MKSAFTLIELVIVIAVLGILAAGLLTALDPVEQLNRATDATKAKKAVDILNAAHRDYLKKQAWPTSVSALYSIGELSKDPGAGYTITGGTTEGPWACFTPTSKTYKTKVGTATTTGIKSDTGSTTVNPTNITSCPTGGCYYCINPS